MPGKEKVSSCFRGQGRFNSYLTRSAKLRACNGLLARLATSSSAMVVELGGCDHLWADGDGCRAKLEHLENGLEREERLGVLSQDRNGLEKRIMVALNGLASPQGESESVWSRGAKMRV